MSLRNRFGGVRRRDGDLRMELSRGGPVRIPCRLRRTSARGWGPWTHATLVLSAITDGEARWTTEDPVSVGFASTLPVVDLPFELVTDIYLRSVRFRTEAFWGMQNDIVVVASERATIEVALQPGDAEPVAARLEELLRPHG